MNLKKLIIPVLSSIILSSSVMAANLKVGDKMPEPNGNFIYDSPWVNDDPTLFGKVHYFDSKDNNKVDYMKVFRTCEHSEIYFGYFDGKVLYLDNKPNDGYIDEVGDTVKGRSGKEDIPECRVRI